MRLLWSLVPCTLLNAVYDALINSSCIWICCDYGLPSFSRSFFDSCIEVQTRNFSRLLTTVVLIIPPLLTAQMPKLRLASDFPCRCPALPLRFQIREQGTSRGRQVGFKTPLTQELREPSSSNDSDNDQSSPSTSLPHTCNSNQLRVCIVNFCSLVSYNKHLELYQFIETHKPDIIIGTEPLLNRDIDSREIFPPNYVYSPPVRKDQDSGEKRGGVVIAVNSNIISVEQSSPAECEIVWCNISHKSGSVVVGSFYRPLLHLLIIWSSMNSLWITSNNSVV